MNGACLSAISKKLLLRFSYWELISEFGSISQFILSRSHKKFCSSKFLKLLCLEYLGLEFGLLHLTSMAITLWLSKVQIFPHFLSRFVKIYYCLPDFLLHVYCTYIDKTSDTCGTAVKFSKDEGIFVSLATNSSRTRDMGMYGFPAQRATAS